MENKLHRTSDDSTKLPYKLIKEITNNFDEERILGSGGFGTVYKGVYENNEEIAVKILRNMSGFDGKEFRKEFQNLRGLKHQNVVELVGFCDESNGVLVEYEGNLVTATETHQALCFEYVQNGSLQKHISGEYTGLDWHTRYKIIKGICMGLKYLREGLKYPVMHLDLKPDNILLDKAMEPKIADFGLSRLFGEENTRKTISSIGTIGYLPPEYIKFQVISEKFDIFSLGVIITKIMTGTEGYKIIADMEPKEFIMLVHDNWRKRLREILMPRPLEVYCYQVKRCIEIALQCIKTQKERPTIQDIVSNLIKTETLIGDLELKMEQVHDNWRKKLREILMPRPLEVYCYQVKRCIEITLQCIKTQKERPTIQDIVSNLIKTETLIGDLELKMEQFSEESILTKTDMPERSPPEIATYATGGKTGGSKTLELSAIPREVPFDFLKKITDDFSPERILSEDAFGTLYKGIIEQDGEVVIISVKKLGENAPVPSAKVFVKEVQNIMTLNHENIVKLIHFCHEEKKKVVQIHGKYIIQDIVNYLLCYEYVPKGSLHQYIFGEPHNADWGTRFKIIKGICNGLLFLHKISIVHMDLKPENILLDNEMMPKIKEFGVSRIFDQEQSRLNTLTIVGSYGYIAPEYLYRGQISTQADIYSLGLVIIETTTGEKNNSGEKNEPTAVKFIEKIREKWTLEHIASVYAMLPPNGIMEVKKCIDIGLDCVQTEYRKRPSIDIIVQKLNELPETRSGSNILLNLQPPQLSFPCEPKRLPSCSLNLTNITDHHIAFKLVTKQTTVPRRYLVELPLYGIVPPKCTYTLTVIMREQKKPPPSSRDDFLTLQSSRARDVNPASVAEFLETAGDEVQEVKVAVVCEPPKRTMSSQIIASRNYRQVLSVDMHSTKPWILTSNKGGYACIWNYRTRTEVEPFEVSEEGEPVYSAKFVEREKWLVVGRSDGYIYVYNYDTMDEVKRVEAHAGPVTSLAIHPTQSSALSASDDHLIKLWDWSENWVCTQTFEGHNKRITQVMFDPNDSNCFASASLDGTVKIWNSSAGTCIITLDGHPDGQFCLQYFTGFNRPLLISGSSDATAKIWDLQTDNCISTLEIHGNHLSALCWHPELPILITGSLDGTVRIWKSTTTTYRLQNIISFNLGAVNALGYTEGLKRIVAGCDQGVAMMEINLS